MRNVWEELKHNLSGSVLVTLVLIAQFAVFFWQGTLIASYFADTSTESLSLSVQGDYAYYHLAYSINNEEEEEALWGQSSDPNFVSNAAETYRKVHEDPDLHYMVFGTSNLFVSFDDMNERFTLQELMNLHTNSDENLYHQTDAETVPLESLTVPVQNGEWTSGFPPQIYRLDQAAAEHFQLRVSEGRMLEEQDYQFRWDQGSIPILVGSAYASGFKPGDRIRADLYGIPYQFQVIGILEKNTGIITDKDFSEMGVPLSLDHAILMPYFNIEESPRNSKEEFLALANYDEAFIGGIVVLDAEAPRSELLRIEKKICDVFLRNGLYPVTTAVSPYGVSLFKIESQKTMQILGFGLLAAAVTSLIFIRKLRTVDIEEIIRREE